MTGVQTCALPIWLVLSTHHHHPEVSTGFARNDMLRNWCYILCHPLLCQSGTKEDVAKINASIFAIRGKIRRSIVLRTNVIYEVSILFFSDMILALMDDQFLLRGRWPMKRYKTVLSIRSLVSRAHTFLSSEPTPSFLLMDVQGTVIATYIYQLIEGEVRVEKIEWRKEPEAVLPTSRSGAMSQNISSPTSGSPIAGGSVW